MIMFYIELLLGFIYIVAVTIICIVSWPITIPILAGLNYLNDSLKKRCANLFYCSSCDKILGNPAIKLADVEWNKFILEHPLAQKQNVPRNDAICIYCDTKFTYLKLARKFVVSSEA
jgi:hypothetical protein